MTVTRSREEDDRRQEPSEGSSRIIVPVLELCDDTVLTSRRKGEQMRSLFERSAGITPVVILDFAGVEVVTPSFFMGGVWPLWERGQLEQYPLLANLPADSLDDVTYVTMVTRNPIWTGRLTSGRFREPLLLGELEESDELVLSRIFESGSTSAADMVSSGGRMGATGWNNRLAGLWQRKLLMRMKSGRLFQYSVPWKGSG